MNGTPKVEPVRISDWLLYEEDDIGRFSRDIVTVAASQTLACGAVVGLNAGGEVIEYDNETVVADNETVVAGGDVAVGILTEAVTTGAGVTQKAVIIARHARIAPSMLTWKAGLDGTGKTAGLADLKALGILPVPAEV